MAIVNGYVMIWMPNHHRASTNGMTYEHIVEAEKMLGRELKPEEVVHHKDENRSNNSWDNLLVFATKNDHARFHMTGIMQKEQDYYISPVNEISARAFLNSNGNIKKFKELFPDYLYLLNTCKVCGKLCVDKYCSQKCAHIDSRIFNPTKEELKADLLSGIPMTKIGEKYGVSDNAVRRRLRLFNLPAKYQDIKKYIKQYNGVEA